MRIPKHTLHHPTRPASIPGFRLPRWQKRAVYLLVGLLTASGLMWLVAHYFMRPSTEFGVVVHPMEPWSMKLHGAAAMASLWLVGTLLQVHIRRAFLAKRNLWTGWSMIAVLATLVLSGYALYYIAGEDSRPWWSAIHWLLGLLLPTLLFLHVLTGRRALRRQQII